MGCIRTICPCGHCWFSYTGGGDCPKCGKDVNNCLWFDNQAITHCLEEQSMDGLSSVMLNGSPMLRVIDSVGGACSWEYYIHWDTKLHPDKTRVAEMRRRFLLGLDIFTGEEINE